MNDKNTDALLKLINDLISLVSKNVDNINNLAEEIANLKAKRWNIVKVQVAMSIKQRTG